MRFWSIFFGLVAAFAVVGGIALATGGGSPSAPAGDVKGPCDEAEHAGDPECAGPQVPEDDGAQDGQGDDVKGPCDEAEHAGDPQCAGPQEPEDDVRGDDDAGDDVSGPCDEPEHADDPRCT